MKGNAKIESTMLGINDHGILTCFLDLEQEGGSAQGFGGYILATPESGDTKECCKWVREILRVVGVERWEDLIGKYVRVDGEKQGKIKGIGHITRNEWFYPENKK